MNDASLESRESLHISRTYPNALEKVYAAWTDPELLAQWWGPPGSTVKEIQVDFQIGGKYRISFEHAQGMIMVVHGVYKEIEPRRKLVFTWRWENPEMDIGYSLVTLDFVSEGGNTILNLTHEKLPTIEARIGHEEGWIGILGSLTEYLK